MRHTCIAAVHGMCYKNSMIRDDPNVYYIDAEESARCAVPDEPRGRAVDQRVARRLDAAVEEVRLELADEAREDSSDAGGGISPDVAGRLSAAQIRYLAALRLRPSVGVAMRMACRSAGSAVSGTQPSSMMRLPDVAAFSNWLLRNASQESDAARRADPPP